MSDWGIPTVIECIVNTTYSAEIISSGSHFKTFSFQDDGETLIKLSNISNFLDF